MNQSGATQTRRGRVVYRRKPHGFTGRDAARVLRAYGNIANPTLTLPDLLKLFQFLLQYHFLWAQQIKSIPYAEVPWWSNSRAFAGEIAQITKEPRVRQLANSIFGALGEGGREYHWEISRFVAEAWLTSAATYHDTLETYDSSI